MALGRLWPVLALAWLAGCSVERFDRAGVDTDDSLYASVYPLYAEFCALSQIKKIRGFGAEIRGEIGGHAVFYLNGACRDPDTAYPTLRLCDAIDWTTHEDPPVSGVGLSMNAHFANAKWVAIPGRSFFFAGDLPPGHGLTRADYAAVQARAKQLRIYSGITFHAEVFDDMPAGTTQEDYKYEVSVATDYAISLGRGRFCAKIPATRPQMIAMIAFLNAQNAPYRDGREVFNWGLFQDNCIHLAHNALAVAGLWAEWPINQSVIRAIFDFPVPKNEFVNIMRRINDPPRLDLPAMRDDESAARSLAAFGQLPFRPGTLADAHPPQRPNEVYETDLKLIFFDDPVFGHYQGRFDAIFRDPRYFDIARNLDYFAQLYDRSRADRPSLEAWLAQARFATPAERQEMTDLYQLFYASVEEQRGAIEADRRRLRTAVARSRSQ